MTKDNIGEFFQLTKLDGSGYRFREHPCGLYYIDTCQPDSFIMDPDYLDSVENGYINTVQAFDLE